MKGLGILLHNIVSDKSIPNNCI